MNTVKISVLLAVYNGEKYISKSIDSVLNQTFNDFEILIGFNGTTDKSKKIVNGYNDSRIRVFDFYGDKGKAKTLNKLLGESRGEWIAIQDDDDIWVSSKLENQLKFLNDFDIIGSQIRYINEIDEITGDVKLAKADSEIKRKSLSGDNQVANTSAIVRKKCAEEINGWETDIDGIEDFDFWLRLMRKGFKFINLESVEVFHRLHTQSNFNVKQHDLSAILRQDEKIPEKESFWKKVTRLFN